MAERVGDGGSAALKALATEVINESLRELRRRRRELLADPGYLDGVLLDGTARATATAVETLHRVQRAMGMDYLGWVGRTGVASANGVKCRCRPSAMVRGTFITHRCRMSIHASTRGSRMRARHREVTGIDDAHRDAPTTPGGRQSGPAIWPKKRLQTSRGRRVGNAVVTQADPVGSGPAHLRADDDRSQDRPAPQHPVTLVEQGEKRWLVAPYGPVSWVLNARAAGRVTISRRGRDAGYAIEELGAEQAGPILKEYLKIASATRPYFEATKDSPVADFIAEASRHPVFELTLVTDPRG